MLQKMLTDVSEPEKLNLCSIDAPFCSDHFDER